MSFYAEISFEKHLGSLDKRAHSVSASFGRSTWKSKGSSPAAQLNRGNYLVEEYVLGKTNKKRKL